jgi:hypothetical protein
MSLINDALRRAHQAQKKRADTPPLGVPLQPVDYQRRPKSRLVLWAVPGAALLLTAAGWFVWQAVHSSAKPGPLPQRANVTAGNLPASSLPGALTPANSAAQTMPDKPKLAINTNVVTRMNPRIEAAATRPATTSLQPPSVLPPANEAPRLAATPVASPAPAAAQFSAAPNNASPPPAADPVPGPKASFPALKLQGIFFRLVNPTVLINGRTLRMGDRIAEAKIVAIKRQSVTLVFEGQTNVLTME